MQAKETAALLASKIKERGLSQRAVLREAGCSNNTLWRWSTFVGKPQQDALDRIEAAIEKLSNP